MLIQLLLLESQLLSSQKLPAFPHALKSPRPEEVPVNDPENDFQCKDDHNSDDVK